MKFGRAPTTVTITASCLDEHSPRSGRNHVARVDGQFPAGVQRGILELAMGGSQHHRVVSRELLGRTRRTSTARTNSSRAGTMRSGDS